MKFCTELEQELFEMEYKSLLPKRGRTSGPFWTLIRRYVNLWDIYLQAEAYIQELTEMFENEAIEAGVVKLNDENKRLRRMLDWALKPETQAALQADFDKHDRMIKETGNA